MSLRPEELWIMATAVCAAVACSIPGCFLVLRRMSLLGDAISHAVLPGLAVAFILSGTRDVQWMLLGALVLGEPLTGGMLVGLVLVLGSVLLVNEVRLGTLLPVRASARSEP